MSKSVSYIKILNQLNLFAICIFVFSMNFKSVANPLKLVSLGVFAGSWLLEFVINKRWRFYTFDIRHILFFSVVLFFLLGYLYYPIDMDTKELLFIQERKLFLLVISIVLIFGLGYDIKLNYLLYALVLGVIAALFIVLKSTTVKDFFHPNVFLERLQYHMHHAPFALGMNLAAAGNLYLIYSKFRWYKLFYIIPLVFISYFIIICHGKISIVIFSFIILIFLFYSILRPLFYKLKQRYLRVMFIGIAIMFISYGAPKIFSNHVRFNKIESVGATKLFANNSFPRLKIWRNSWNCIKEKWVLGYGIGGGQLRLSEEHKKYGMYKNIESLFHTHNQILQSWLQFGILGLLLSFIIYFLPFLLYKNKHYLLILMFSTVFLIASMTEPMLHKSFGIFPYCIALFIMFNNKRNHKPSTRKDLH